MHELTWGLPVIAYLFLAGVGGGAVTVSGSVLLRKGGFGASRFAVARIGALIGPIPVMLGTFLIVFELGQPLRALNLFKIINLSPMSIGSWLLGVFTVLCTLYALTFLLPGAGPGDRLAPNHARRHAGPAVLELAHPRCAIPDLGAVHRSRDHHHGGRPVSAQN
jgi:formate-dependent nitrite reductase membrane component NrfD